MPQLAGRLALFASVLLLSSGIAHAQAADGVPERTAAAREALAAASWETVEEGFAVLRATAANGTAMTVFRISPERFKFGIALQEKPEGERVQAYGEREGAVIAVNGGFFGEREDNGRLFPVGLLRLGGRNRSQPWAHTGGFLALSEGGVAIHPSSTGVPDTVPEILQSKPLIMEPGGKWAMNTNQGYLRKRNILCLTRDGDVLMFFVTRAGLSVYEAGWLMRDAAAGGFFDCDAALALDGGGSTQIWVEGHEELSLRGETPINNALLVRRRDADASSTGQADLPTK